MTRKHALKRMRRLFPSIARREAFARRQQDGTVMVGVELRGGNSRNEVVRSWRGSSWEEAVTRAARERVT